MPELALPFAKLLAWRVKWVADGEDDAMKPAAGVSVVVESRWFDIETSLVREDSRLRFHVEARY